jgi:hypothetical protein
VVLGCSLAKINQTWPSLKKIILKIVKMSTCYALIG